MAKPIRALELHYLMIQFLIINVITWQEPILSVEPDFGKHLWLAYLVDIPRFVFKKGF